MGCRLGSRRRLLQETVLQNFKSPSPIALFCFRHHSNLCMFCYTFVFLPASLQCNEAFRAVLLVECGSFSVTLALSLAVI